MLFVFCLCHTVLSVSWSLVITCWDLGSLVCDVFLCFFVTFPYDDLGQVWYLIVSIPDLCLLPYWMDEKT